MTLRPLLLPGLLVAVWAGCTAFTAGGTAYTKRMETALLEAPTSTASVVATFPYGKQLKVREVKGAWLMLAEGKSAGWVFRGNVSDVELKEKADVDFLPKSGAGTTATAAARPLAPQASAYAERKGMNAAKEDILWLEKQAAKVRAKDVEAYLQAMEKGEYSK